MKIKIQLVALCLLGTLFPMSLLAQGTAFTYQGRLDLNGAPANGSYDIRFVVYDNDPGGSQQGPVLTNTDVAVSEGVFTVTLDFGAVFPGADRWLDIAVRTNGSSAFTELSPRQALTPTPYAITAGTVTPGAGLSGAYGSAVTFSNSADSFAGSFTGNGAKVTNVNAATLNGLASANFWQLGGNNVANGQFLGSANNQPVEIHVNNQRVMQFAYASNSADGYSPNLIGGVSGNYVSNGVVGATIAGGGSAFLSSQTNGVSADFGTVLGGAGNEVSGGYALAGGYFSIATGFSAIALGSSAATGSYSIAAGASFARGDSSAALGESTASGTLSTALGQSTASGTLSTALGESTASGASSIAEGQSTATNIFAIALGECTSTGQFSVALGESTCTGDYATALGQSTASGAFSIASGYMAQAIGNNSTGLGLSVAGGDVSTAIGESTANGSLSVALGMSEADGDFSFAAGNSAQAKHPGCFVWADDSTTSPIASTGFNQFLIRAEGGVILDDASGTDLNFGNATRQMVNLYSTSYGIGVQSSTLYQRSNSRFSWYKGGVHSDTQDDPGTGGSVLMTLTSSGLTVNGTFASMSDRNAKQDFAPVSPAEVLDKVAALPITKWMYKADPDTRHIGPMAQDFYAAFAVGTDDKHIATVDEGGVALAAIQGLNQKLNEKDAEIQNLKRQNDSLAERLNELEASVKQLAGTK